MKKGFGNTNKSKLIMPVAVTALTVILSAALAVAFFNITRGTNPNVNADELSGSETVEASGTESGNSGNTVFVTENDEMRGVWVASIGNLNYPSQKGLSADELALEIDEIIDTCADVGFNTIFFQVRPAGDALYKSDIYPWSEYVSGTQGVAPDKEFDSLEYILEKAKEHGIEVHAWVNPFRASNGSASKPQTDVSALAQSNPARLNPEYTVAYADGKLYYNPGIPQVRELIVSGISELCEKYPDLSGIHIDDYFYPYPSGDAEFDDSAAYEEYGNGMELADWRRSNVNSFVKAAYDAVKAKNSEMRFGVSPFGIWANSGSGTYVNGSDTTGLEAYHTLYCDALAWANGGYVDYLVPQIYWSFSTKAAPFDSVARWWNANLDGTGVDFYIGHAAYKAADYGENEIPMQIEFGRSLLTCRGSVFYGYADIAKNTAGLQDGLRLSFKDGIEINEPESTGEKPQVTYPTSNSTTDNATYVLGSSDPSAPVTINGEKVSRTKDGYFSFYTNLNNGRNSFEIKSGDSVSGYVINKVTGSTGFVAPNELTTYEITECKPSKATWLAVGDTLTVSCSAPSGSKVTARVGGVSINLKPTMYSATTDKNYREVYKGSVRISTVFAPDGGEADLGTLTFYAEKNGKSATKSVSLVRQLGKGALIYAEVKNDYSYYKNSPTSSFYDDPTPQQIGMRDYIVAYVDGYYRLRSGYYVSEDDVTVVRDSSLYDNKIISVVAEASVGSNLNNLDNTTDIRFGVLENVPVTVKVEGDRFIVTLHNTDPAFLPNAEIAKNPMITSAAASAGQDCVIYEFKLRNAENYYGFNIVYKDGFAIVKLNNPQSLVPGEKPLSGKTIIVDAGHGGDDIGAPGPAGLSVNLHEADLNLSIAAALRDRLSARGANVIMIRDEDETIDLYARIDILASMIPDMAISIHHNSIANTTNAAKTRGYLGLYSDNAGVMLANAVADTVSTQLSRLKRPTAYQMLAVARNHRYPTTLCEMSFICNVEEFQWTISPGNYERSANAVADGILEFYKRQAQYLSY